MCSRMYSIPHLNLSTLKIIAELDYITNVAGETSNICLINFFDYRLKNIDKLNYITNVNDQTSYTCFTNILIKV